MKCSLDVCTIEFEPIKSNQKYCSPKHRYRAQSARNRTIYYKNCKLQSCSGSFSTTDSKAKYCSRSCAAIFNNAVKSKRIRDAKPVKKTKVQEWLDNEWDATTKNGLSSTIRNYLLEQAQFKCQDGRSGCNNWGEINPKSGKSCLTVDHTDGNCMNNKLENLVVMCPNCHSMTPTYGSLNKGNGRTFRYNKSPVA